MSELQEDTRLWNNQQKQQWLEDNSSLIWHCVRKFLDYFSKVPAIDLHDLYQIASIAVLSAFESFDVSKGAKFSTYASICMENRLKMSVRTELAMKRPSNISSLDDETVTDFLQSNSQGGTHFSPEDLYVCREKLRDIYDYIEKREGKNAEVIFTVLCNELSQCSAANLIHCSQSKISQSVKKFRKELTLEFKA